MSQEYIQRINKALQFIDSQLHNDLSLAAVANAACYSPFHLHRLFKAISNETLNQYILRKRVERSAILLIHHPSLSMADIASQCGFKSDSVFSRSFKKYYGLSPSAFRKKHQGQFRKIGKTDSKNGQEDLITADYLRNIQQLKNWIRMNANITVTHMPAKHLAYLTQLGEKGLENTFDRLIAWANSKNLLADSANTICRVFHDSFKITEADNVRMSIGLLSPQPLKSEGDISVMRIEPSRCIVARFEIHPNDFENAWNSLFIWMNENAYKKSEAFPFEMYHNNYLEHPQQKCLVDLCIPISG